MKTVYFDNGATTPMCEPSLKAMCTVASDSYGNPSGTYGPGFAAGRILNDSRAEIASALNCFESEIIFTSGGTEGDNTALFGAFFASEKSKKHIITTMIEHHAVLNTCRFLEKQGASVTYLRPSKDGRIAPEAVKEAIRPDTVLISVMHANNETGAVQPIEEIGRIAGEYGIPFHTDAVCTFGKIPIDLHELKADLLSVSAHKFYGPKGTGFLFARRGTVFEPFMHGGSQEEERRGGTENVPAIAGMAAAGRYCHENMEEHAAAAGKRRDLLWELISGEIEGVHMNPEAEGPQRKVPGFILPGTLNVRFDGVKGESLLILLDGKGICASAGAACERRGKKISHVLTAMGYSEKEASGSVRFTLSHLNTEEEVRYAASAVKESVGYLRRIGFGG